MSYEPVVKLDGGIKITYNDTAKVSVWLDDSVVTGTQYEKYAEFVNDYCEGQRVIVAVTNPDLNSQAKTSFDTVNNGKDALIIANFIKKITVKCDIYVNANFDKKETYWNLSYDNWKNGSDKIIKVNYDSLKIPNSDEKITDLVKSSNIPSSATEQYEKNGKSKMSAFIYWINVTNNVIQNEGYTNRIKGCMFDPAGAVYIKDAKSVTLMNAYRKLSDSQLGDGFSQADTNFSLIGWTDGFNQPLIDGVDLFVAQYYDFFYDDTANKKFNIGTLDPSKFSDDVTVKYLPIGFTNSKTGKTGKYTWNVTNTYTDSDGNSVTGGDILDVDFDANSEDGDYVSYPGSIYKEARDSSSTVDEMFDKTLESLTLFEPGFIDAVKNSLNSSNVDKYVPFFKVDCNPHTCSDCTSVNAASPNYAVAFGYWNADVTGQEATKISNFSDFIPFMTKYEAYLSGKLGVNLNKMGIYNFRYMPTDWGGYTT